MGFACDEKASPNRGAGFMELNERWTNSAAALSLSLALQVDCYCTTTRTCYRSYTTCRIMQSEAHEQHSNSSSSRRSYTYHTWWSIFTRYEHRVRTFVLKHFKKRWRAKVVNIFSYFASKPVKNQTRRQTSKKIKRMTKKNTGLCARRDQHETHDTARTQPKYPVSRDHKKQLSVGSSKSNTIPHLRRRRHCTNVAILELFAALSLSDQTGGSSRGGDTGFAACLAPDARLAAAAVFLVRGRCSVRA